jgi:hypothetical protein
VSRQSAARNATQPAHPSQAFAERDTLEAIDQDFLRDQLEALLASPTLSRVADRHSEGRDNPADFDGAAARGTERDLEIDSDCERDTEPSIETRLLREALRAGLK